MAITAADGCVQNDTEVARTDTVVAPELHRRGLTATGTVQTGTIPESDWWCTHYDRSLAASWADLATLRDVYGWSMVSHSRTRAEDLETSTRERQISEVCGSRDDLFAHGHMRADGLFAYPNNKFGPTVQAEVVAKCYAFGRRYGGGLTEYEKAVVSPYWQNTQPISGGRCNDSTLPCYNLSSTTLRYRHPQTVVNALNGLAPGDWWTMQFYLLVTGQRPDHWDCTSEDPADHWTNDHERYCYVDFLHILDRIPSTVTVTDPKTVADAWLRTGYTG